ncbi:MAG: hypothetical protein WAK42_07850 [Mycobacterium sp.]|jgi:hypothetical protein
MTELSDAGTAVNGDDGGLAPQGNPAARWSQSGPFVNTGRHLLADYDYLFDAEAGHIGFRKDPA